MMRRIVVMFALALAVPALATGCDKKGAEGAEGAAGAEAAAEEGGNPLVGTWSLDIETFKSSEEFKAMPDDQKKQAEAMMGAMQMDMTFTADTISMSGKMGEEEMPKTEAKYTLKEGKDGAMTLETVEIKDGKEGKKETIELTLKDGVLTMAQGGQKMTFKKK